MKDTITNGVPSADAVHVVEPALYALRNIISTLDPIPDADRVKALRCAAAWFGIESRVSR